MKRLVVFLALMVAVPAAGQEVERIRGADVAIYNLAGQVQIVRGSGSEVVVHISRGGDDARRLEVRTGEVDGRQTLRVVYPSDEIVYPDMGRGSTQLRVRSDGTFSDGRRGDGDRVSIENSGRGLEAWADLVIEVPAGQRAAVHLAVGRVEAEGVDARLEIDTGAGAVAARAMSGSLEIDTGSGNVRVDGMDGDLNVDTGSGDVEVFEVSGSAVDLDTGSGRVTARGLSAREVVVDTGSGRVTLEALSAPSVSVDTGSGSVEIELLSDVDELEVDTGSGSVTLRVPDDFGAEIDVETGSGGIDLDIPVEVRSVRRNMMRGIVGDGRGEISIETGSGSVKLLRR